MNIIEIITPIIEILIFAFIFNYLLSFFWNTKSMDVLLGALAFLLLFVGAYWLNFPALLKIMQVLAGAAVIAFLIIFQPELRVALAKLSWKGRRYREITEFDKFLDQLTTSSYRLAEKKIGALIVLENEDSLEEYVQRSVILQASFSSELLETIFTIGTPLHDGAVIIRDQTIVAASSILPLADESSQLLKSMGTRHRAGLGLSNVSDSLIIVVSEETGKVAIVREGIMTIGIKIDRFKGIIKSIFNPPTKITFKSKFNLREWLKQ